MNIHRKTACPNNSRGIRENRGVVRIERAGSSLWSPFFYEVNQVAIGYL